MDSRKVEEIEVREVLFFLACLALSTLGIPGLSEPKKATSSFPTGSVP